MEVTYTVTLRWSQQFDRTTNPEGWNWTRAVKDASPYFLNNMDDVEVVGISSSTQADLSEMLIDADLVLLDRSRAMFCKVDTSSGGVTLRSDDGTTVSFYDQSVTVNDPKNGFEVQDTDGLRHVLTVYKLKEA